MKVKEESEKVGLKLNIQKSKIMACGPIIDTNALQKNKKDRRMRFRSYRSWSDPFQYYCQRSDSSPAPVRDIWRHQEDVGSVPGTPPYHCGPAQWGDTASASSGLWLQYSLHGILRVMAFPSLNICAVDSLKTKYRPCVIYWATWNRTVTSLVLGFTSL